MDITFGQINNVLNDKGFGFIATDAGNVFFHKSACQAWEKLKHGMAVTFKLVDTARGKAAENVTIVEQAQVNQISKGFIWRESATPKRGQVEFKGSIRTHLFAAPRDAKAHLKQLAKDANCNAVLNATFHRKTVQAGFNYYTTYHYYSGDIALVTEDVSVLRRDAEQAERKYVSDVAVAKAAFEEVISERNTPQPHTTESNIGAISWIIAACVLLAIFL
ncbi:cold-shock protein [Alteromonas oceanisediminis]|uniref:cold-shock protein n=1 Tax=Alteromonas oceanisediminis TaxID=2836180 RepID=UPI001BDA2C07|nr:cold shock domain-containing protein [Alteromonas oceanisediminis]MBT0587939.1 cold shock domain-containing protein [Alteromonas oceanisediminis]